MLPKFRPAPVGEGEVRPTIRPVKLTAPPPPPSPPSPAKRATTAPPVELPSEDAPQFAGDAPETWVPPRRQVDALAKITYQPARFDDPPAEFHRSARRDPLDAFEPPFGERRREERDRGHGQLTPPSLSAAPPPRRFEPMDAGYDHRADTEHPRHATTRAYGPEPKDEATGYPPARRDYARHEGDRLDLYGEARALERSALRRESPMRERERERERAWEQERERAWEQERERAWEQERVREEYTYPPVPRREAAQGWDRRDMSRAPRQDHGFGAFPHAPTPPSTVAPMFAPPVPPVAQPLPQAMHAVPQAFHQAMPPRGAHPVATQLAPPGSRLHTTGSHIVQTVPSHMRSMALDASQRAKTIRFAWFVFGAAFGICFAFFATGFATRRGKHEEGPPAAAALAPVSEAVLPGSPGSPPHAVAAPRPPLPQPVHPVVAAQPAPAPQAPAAVAQVQAPAVLATPGQPSTPPIVPMAQAPATTAAPTVAPAQPAQLPPAVVAPAPPRRVPAYVPRATGDAPTSSRRNSEEVTDLLNAGLAP